MAASFESLKAFLSELKGFKENNTLKSSETRVTTVDGKTYVEKKTEDGETVISDVSHGNQGCIDLTPDLVVGIAMEGLLVASQDVTHDLSILKSHGVTHILNVAYGLANVFPEDFEYLKVALLDSPAQDFLSHCPTFEQFIDQGRSKGKVLVHCNAGRSRSAAVALAYVMSKERLSLDKALARLKETRQAVHPNIGFMTQLRTLENKLGISS